MTRASLSAGRRELVRGGAAFAVLFLVGTAGYVALEGGA